MTTEEAQKEIPDAQEEQEETKSSNVLGITKRQRKRELKTIGKSHIIFIIVNML